MANVTFNNATIRPRGDTASNWSSANPILAKNEVGYDETNKKFKIGDGTTPWNSLPYCNIAPSNSGVYYVEGTGTTEGTWTGSSSDITSYYDGLIIAYKLNIAGASTTTLNINGLGAKTVYLRGDTKLTTHYAVNTVILAVYTTVSGVGRWYVNDYDANSYAYVRQYKTTTSADYPMLLAYETTLPSSYDTKYTRKNSTITANPSTGTIKATKFDGTATKAIADENGNNIADTYALKSDMEPINVGGGIDDWGEDFGVSALELTDENYQKFIKNPYAPILVEDGCAFNVDYFTGYDDEFSCDYSRIYNGYVHYISIIWSPNNESTYRSYSVLATQRPKLELDFTFNTAYATGDLTGEYSSYSNLLSSDFIEIIDSNGSRFVLTKRENPIQQEPIYFTLTYKQEDENVVHYFTFIAFDDDTYEYYYADQEIGTQVSYTPTLTEGTKIGTITINGTNTDLYAPEGGISSEDSLQITINKANIEDLQGIAERHNTRIQTLEDSNKESIDLSNYVDLNSEQYLYNKFLASNIQIGEATVVSAGGLTIAGVLKDKNNTAGVSGQILSSTGTGVEWKTIELGSSTYTKITDEVYFYDFVYIYIASNTPDGNYSIASQTVAGMLVQTVVTISSGVVSLNMIVDGSVEESYDYTLVAPNIYKNIEKNRNGIYISVTPTEYVYFVNYTSTSENADSLMLDVSPFIAPLDERITALENNSGTSSSGGLNIYNLSGELNFDDPSLPITASQLVEVRNANAISVSALVTGLGQCNVILYICSSATNYICFTDAMFIIEGQKFYVRKAYIDVATLTLNFTPDA